ncbi:MAG: purine-binding chemotaxis protein CheW [Candidatus Magnetoglobus multicellularis str. Araruama]|uniref:Purine-binding chemotaxis protein CheW n=1 Tax=Candidatus Magnetoglobus multicellularis str. Araruama TaxID=890399 RepID=A0A1V1PI88_9BACT|nr:MAG: purine-binding chemotaxis protein CheW [Candidatus Magnetoglobus multicellularis str. Araruama]
MNKLKNITSEQKKLPESKRQFCSFQMAGHCFGVDILDVKEIIDEVVLTTIHHAPSEMLGFVNIRGHVHLVLDLRLLLNFSSKPIDESSRVLLFHPNVGESFGVMVDQIGHMIEVEESLIEYRLTDENLSGIARDFRKSELEKGVCKLKDRLLIILDASNFLSAVELKR